MIMHQATGNLNFTLSEIYASEQKFVDIDSAFYEEETDIDLIESQDPNEQVKQKITEIVLLAETKRALIFLINTETKKLDLMQTYEIPEGQDVEITCVLLNCRADQKTFCFIGLSSGVI